MGCKNTFPNKLWWLVHSHSTSVEWTECGKRVLIDFEEIPKILEESSVFKTRNLSSFVRNLNLYGFRMINKINKSQSKKVYHHPHFVKGHESWVDRIGRNGAVLHINESENCQKLKAIAIEKEKAQEVDDTNRRYPKRNRTKRLLASYDVDGWEGSKSSTQKTYQRKKRKISKEQSIKEGNKEEIGEENFTSCQESKRTLFHRKNNNPPVPKIQDAEDCGCPSSVLTSTSKRNPETNQFVPKCESRAVAETPPEHNKILEDMPLAFRTRHKAQELAHILAPEAPGIQRPRKQEKSRSDKVCTTDKTNNFNSKIPTMDSEELPFKDEIKSSEDKIAEEEHTVTNLKPLGVPDFFHITSTVPKSDAEKLWTWVLALEEHEKIPPPIFDFTTALGEDVQNEETIVKTGKFVIDEVRNQLFKTLEWIEKTEFYRKCLLEKHIKKEYESKETVSVDHIHPSPYTLCGYCGDEKRRVPTSTNSEILPCSEGTKMDPGIAMGCLKLRCSPETLFEEFGLLEFLPVSRNRKENVLGPHPYVTWIDILSMKQSHPN